MPALARRNWPGFRHRAGGDDFSRRERLVLGIVRKQIEVIDRLYQRKEHVTGIATGFHEFDAQTAGLQPSDLIVLAARPSRFAAA